MKELVAVWGFAAAAVVALLVTPLSARLARSIGAVDEPRERGLSVRATPRLGGLGILAGVLVAAVAFVPGSEQNRGILLGAAAIAVIGALDDSYDLNPAIKLGGQIAAALVPVVLDVRVENVTLPFLGAIYFGPWVGGALTLLGLVLVMNAVNFTDGVDGLAAGVCTIAALTFALIALSLSRYDAGILAAITAGAAAGFLYHNFHPASVFMGDSGSNLLGLLLGCVAIQGVLKTAAVVALVFPLVILAVPIFDTGFVVAKRVKYRRPVYGADRWHFHHRFANIGFSQRRTVLYLYGWTLALSALALALRFVPYTDENKDFNVAWTLVLAAFGLLALAASVYLVFVLEILKFRGLRERQLRRAEANGAESTAEIEKRIAREVETGEWEAVASE